MKKLVSLKNGKIILLLLCRNGGRGGPNTLHYNGSSSPLAAGSPVVLGIPPRIGGLARERCKNAPRPTLGRRPRQAQGRNWSLYIHTGLW